jgi:two-component system response regulator AtoC
MRNYLKNFISHFNYPVYVSRHPQSFGAELDEVKSKISVVVYDMLRVDTVGLNQLESLRRLNGAVHVVLLVGQTQVSAIQDRFEAAPWKVITKPFQPQELKDGIMEVLARHKEVVLTPTDVVFQRYGGGKGTYSNLLLGSSRRMEEVRAVIDRVASTDLTLLIRGESGTGKELTSRTVYERSSRAGKPFVTVLCPAIPEGLLESELFGYEKGAFTGAFHRCPGKFEIANHGTIFLDEIGDIPFGLQSKLLRVLEGGEFSRIGGSSVKVDVRILAATNRDLERAVADGSFREDLYYRLNVLSIYLPPLRERREDIPLLAEYFLRKYNEQFNKPYHQLSPATLQSLLDHDWPGNVRELENLINRIVIMGSEERVLRSHLNESQKKIKSRIGSVPSDSGPPAVVPSVQKKEAPTKTGNGNGLVPLKQVAKEAMRKAEAEAILHALEQTRWNRKEAARLLKISYKALLYKIRQCNLEGESQ